jgi:hypothetical protein
VTTARRPSRTLGPRLRPRRSVAAAVADTHVRDGTEAHPDHLRAEVPDPARRTWRRPVGSTLPDPGGSGSGARTGPAVAVVLGDLAC